jgi:(p)ppGpp synthase/HD superfamily hydrolase
MRETALTDLENAILLATRAHGRLRQRDKTGAPYILHPLTVMLRMSTEPEMIAAILHDVVEDAGVTLEMLREDGYSSEVIEAVDCLTKRESESYEEFIKRLKPNQIARRVKLADLEHNMDVRRLSRVEKNDADRLTRYIHAWHELKAYT